MENSCKKCGGQIIYQTGEKYSKCKYCGFQNYFSSYDQIESKKVIHFLIVSIIILLGFGFYALVQKDASIINNGEINNYNSDTIIIEKQISTELENEKSLDLHNCTNQESTPKYMFDFLKPTESIIKSESSLGVSFISKNINLVKLYALVGEEKKGKWIVDEQIFLKEHRVYNSGYKENTTNYNSVNLSKKLDGKKIRLVAYGFGRHAKCQTRVESDQTIYIESYFDLSKQNIGKNIDLIVQDIKLYDKNNNDLGTNISTDDIVLLTPIIKNIGKDLVYFNHDNLDFSLHIKNGDLDILNGIGRCTDNNIVLKPGELYTCNGGLNGGGNVFFIDQTKKISIKIDMKNDIKEINENNNVGSIDINITENKK